MTKPLVLEQRPFLPARDFARSRRFYEQLGWAPEYDDGSLALLRLGEFRFYLQNAWVREWAENTMLHLPIADVEEWNSLIRGVVRDGAFGEVRVRGPFRESYGAARRYAT